MNIALVLAGGIGTRVGYKTPKQFIEVMGKPILIHTLEVFQNNHLIDEIVLVCVDEYIKLAVDYCQKFLINKIKAVIPGGDIFINSCINGINWIEGNAAEDDIIIVTSADRPLITDEEINDSIEVCRKYGCGISARPCSLCMFEVEKNQNSHPKYMRENLMQTATPWAFNYSSLKNALKKYTMGELKECEPYPIAIYAASGNQIHFSFSRPDNIKITEKHDIFLFEQILKERNNL